MNITVAKKDMDIQSTIILIEILNDIRVINEKFIKINELFINNKSLIIRGMMKVKFRMIDINIIVELLTPHVIVLIKLD